MQQKKDSLVSFILAQAKVIVNENVIIKKLPSFRKIQLNKQK